MVRFARGGFTVLAVSQPGYGKSEGPPDFVGPNTIAVLEQGVGLLAASPYADPHRLGVFGYSRGGLVLRMLAELPETTFGFCDDEAESRYTSLWP